MSSFNYRVVRGPQGTLTIREVYTQNTRIKQQHGYSANAFIPIGRTKVELRRDLKKMLAALGRSVIDLADLEKT